MINSKTIEASNLIWQAPVKQICIQLDPEAIPTEEVVRNLSNIQGPVDVYCWYEGTQGLPKSGALYLKEAIFKPLFDLKKDIKLCLYSLRGWDFKKTTIDISNSTALGKAINRVNKEAIECLYSSSFFQYCTQVSQENAFYTFVNEELPKKQWLIELSANQKKTGITVENLFNNQISLFDCIRDLDVSLAYSVMQYIEGYYLIRESVRKGLLIQQKQINIAFVLPNDEGKYYLDLPKDIERMLELDFGKIPMDVDINISFQFFRFGESLASRPYIDKSLKVSKVKPEEVCSYFDYLVKQSPLQLSFSTEPFLKDVIHNLNGWY